MNYLKVYCNLIRKAENRTPPEGYTEKHHTFPKSIFGNNNRIVVLTAREHYIAHVLLEKIYIKRCGINDMRSIKMTYAHSGMRGNGGYVNSYLYEGARKRRSEIMKDKQYTLGIKWSEERKEEMSKMRKGLKWWNNGIIDVRSLECPGNEWKNGRIKVQIGREYGEETIRKMSETKKGKKGIPSPKGMLGKKHSEKTKRKIKEKNTGKLHTEETKRKISEAAKRRWNDKKIT